MPRQFSSAPFCSSRSSRFWPSWCCRGLAERRRCGPSAWRFTNSRIFSEISTRMCWSSGVGRASPDGFTPRCCWPVYCCCPYCPRLSGSRTARKIPRGAFWACCRSPSVCRFCCFRRQVRCCNRGTRGATGGARPYRLYALSNAGSLLALLSYPAVVEPQLATTHQAWVWSAAYVVFVAVCSIVALGQRRVAVAVDSIDPDHAGAQSPDAKLQLLWLGLAATASALLLCVTHHISQDVAAVPLLWIVPLSLYLLSLIICFEGSGWYRRAWFVRLLPGVSGWNGLRALSRI